MNEKYENYRNIYIMRRFAFLMQISAVETTKKLTE